MKTSTKKSNNKRRNVIAPVVISLVAATSLYSTTTFDYVGKPHDVPIGGLQYGDMLEGINGNFHGGWDINALIYTVRNKSDNNIKSVIGSVLSDVNKLTADNKPWHVETYNHMSNNIIKVDNSTLDYVAGAILGNADSNLYDIFSTSLNTVTVNDSTINKRIFGGYNYWRMPFGNKVTVNNTKVKGGVYSSVYGNRTDLTQFGNMRPGINGVGENNTLTIANGSVIEGDAAGTYTKAENSSATTKNTRVTIDGSTVKGTVYGDGNDELLKNNTLTSSSDNAIVTIRNKSTVNHVYGAKKFNGNIDNSNVTGWAVGASTNKDKTIDKTNLTIGVNTTVKGRVIGANIRGNGSVTGGTVNVANSEVKRNVLGVWANGSGTIKNTTTSVNSSIVNGIIYGGKNEKDGSVIRNIVNISKKTIANGAIGGESNSGEVRDNIVNLSDDSIINGNVLGGKSSTGSTTNNTISIREGVDITGNVIGGEVHDGKFGGKVTNNTVNLYGSINLPNSILYGGKVNNRNGDALTGNTLNVTSDKIIVKEIRNFEKINTKISALVLNGSPIVNLTGDGLTDLSKTTVSVSNLGTSFEAKVVDKITLFSKPNGTISKPKNDIINTMQGVSRGVTIILNKSDKPVVNPDLKPVTPTDDSRAGTGTSTVDKDKDTDKPTIDPKDKDKELSEEDKPVANEVLPSESEEAAISTLDVDGAIGSTTINKKIKNIAETGIADMDAANSASALLDKYLSSEQISNQVGNSSFGLIDNKKIRYNSSGSHVDIKGINLIAGVSHKKENILHGVFFEAGRGSYDSFNSTTQGDVKGNGNSHHFGFGGLVKAELPSNFYAEGSARVGKVKSIYSSNDLGLGNAKADTKYSASKVYYGTHFGLGKIFDLGARSNLDLYSKVYCTRTGSKNVNLSSGEDIKFEAINSIVSKTGFRYGYGFNDNLNLYAGAALEHEFDSKIKAHNSFTNQNIEAPSVKGSTGLFELGVKLNPIGKNDKFSLDVNLQGLTGKKQGIAGGIEAKYKLY
ncbi:autotransporter domain protein [Campylobacter iguaniorum]|uniref:autotransporter outer membrane beta-barrel domain-containing protein n=1 Tax=Campylobacter iguaniorum TaxID=1244531 RepID=UPI00073A1934|nr:autotransporter outer membrane beta-barrel domain-containing protein [Campylobacter iguaniorum]ALV23627.1 autotransporter domain protein [Campylobacter iguaniorum]